MTIGTYTYLALNLFTLSYPLYKSFDHRIRLHERWQMVWPGLLCVGAFFLVWDYLFTRWGIWSFNEHYTLGWSVAGLPIEEWAFFLTVPYAGIFVHEVLKYFFKKDLFRPVTVPLTILLILLSAGLAVFYADRLYTCVNFTVSALFLSLHLWLFGAKWLGRMYLTYLFDLIGFALVNGVLTALPVVEYNNAENLGIRLGTIPVEDLMYSLTLLTMNLTIYEWLCERKAARTPHA